MAVNNQYCEIIYNQEKEHFNCAFFNKATLGSIITGRIGKEVAKVVDVQERNGEDRWGEYREWRLNYKSMEKEDVAFTGSIKKYVNMLVFEILNHSDIPGKKHKHPYGNPYISFPCFEGELFEKGHSCLSFKRQAPFNYPIQWQGRVIDSLREGKNSPLIVTNQQYETIIVSPLNHMLHGTVSITKNPQSVRCGLPRSIAHLPAYTSYMTIVAFGEGVNSTIDLWGNVLQDYHGMIKIDKQADTLLKYISYWTNAGSAYWYKSLNAKSYDHTFKKMIAHHQQIGLNFGSYQLDSWWYQKDGENYTSSIVSWEPKEATVGKNYNSLFSAKKKPKEIKLFLEDKLSYVQGILKKPFGCHFKQLSLDSVYVKADPEGFLLDYYALPKDRESTYQLFRDIFNHPRWQLSYVVHDWLSWMVDRHKGFRDLSASEGYFQGMDWACQDTLAVDNANKHLTLQLCMAQPHITLNSVTMSSVTTLRSTSDSNSFFVEGMPRWRWHLYSSRFIQAMGKYAFYDNRRTKSKHIHPFSAYSKFELIWLGLSCGPIGLGDSLGKENMGLIKKVCFNNGEIIKPDKPAVPLDSCYLFNPFDAKYKKGVTVFTHSKIPNEFNSASYTIHYLLSFSINPLGKKGEVSYQLMEAGISGYETYVLYDYFKEEATLIHTESQQTFQVSGRKFCYQIIAPLINGIGLIGDISKHVTGSSQLISSIEWQSHQVIVTLSVNFYKEKGLLTLYKEVPPKTITMNGRVIAYTYHNKILTIPIVDDFESEPATKGGLTLSIT